jgi:hypothetical protein
MWSSNCVIGLYRREGGVGAGGFGRDGDGWVRGRAVCEYTMQ